MALTRPVLGAQINKAHPLSRGLVSRFMLNEGGGSLVFDAVSHHRGVLVGVPTWLPGGLAFSGVAQYIDLNNPLGRYSFIQNSMRFTIIAKIKLRSLTARQGIFGDAPGSTVKGCFFMWENVDATNGQQALRFAAYHGVSGESVNVRTPNNATITDTINYHTVAVTGNSLTDLKFYVDAVPQVVTNNSVLAALSTSDSTTDAFIGAVNSAGSAILLNASILDDISIYDMPLTPSLIRMYGTDPYANILDNRAKVFAVATGVANVSKRMRMGVGM